MMDKPLRALTTYPQAQQQQQEERFKGILAALNYNRNTP